MLAQQQARHPSGLCLQLLLRDRPLRPASPQMQQLCLLCLALTQPADLTVLALQEQCHQQQHPLQPLLHHSSQHLYQQHCLLAATPQAGL